MISYRLVQSRRHVYELRLDDDVIAEIAFRGGGRAKVVTTAGSEYELEAIDGIRRRVARFGDRNQTVARSSSLGRYAIDLDSATLYWHSQPGPAGTYCWMTGEGLIVVRYARAADGAFLVQVDLEGPLGGDREHVVIIGSYLLSRTWIEVGQFTALPRGPSLAFDAPTR